MIRSDDVAYLLAAFVVMHVLLRACAPSRSRSRLPYPGGGSAAARPRSTSSVSARQAAITPPAWSQEVAGKSGKYILLCDANGNIERLSVDTLLGDIKAKMGESSTQARDEAISTAGVDTSEIKSWLSSHGAGAALPWASGNWTAMLSQRSHLDAHTYGEYQRHVEWDLDTTKGPNGITGLRNMAFRTKDIYLTAVQGQTCPDGTEEVNTEADCKRAASGLGGLPTPGHTDFWYTGSTWGKMGCQAVEHDSRKKKQYRWNTNENNAAIHVSEWRVCRAK
jgi:hypothetical protein